MYFAELSLITELMRLLSKLFRLKKNLRCKMKYYENSTIFHYKWEQVVQGFWRRYPNPQSTHVLSEDTISREVRDGKLYSRRILTKTNRVPKWGERFVSNRVIRIVEESIVDPNEKLFITYTRNVGMARIMNVVEKVTYKASMENCNWTVAHRSAWIDSQVFGFKSAITAFGLDRFRKNCQKMVIGFNYVLSKMFPQNTAPVTAEETASHVSKAEKLRDVAKTASDLAKSKAKSMIVSCEPKEL